MNAGTHVVPKYIPPPRLYCEYADTNNPAKVEVCKFPIASMATQIASTIPSSPSYSSWKYDVFLSFCGDDTRKNFRDHLYTALKQKGIITFMDNEKLERGKYIS